MKCNILSKINAINYEEPNKWKWQTNRSHFFQKIRHLWQARAIVQHWRTIGCQDMGRCIFIDDNPRHCAHVRYTKTKVSTFAKESYNSLEQDPAGYNNDLLARFRRVHDGFLRWELLDRRCAQRSPLRQLGHPTHSDRRRYKDEDLVPDAQVQRWIICEVRASRNQGSRGKDIQVVCWRAFILHGLIGVEMGASWHGVLGLGLYSHRRHDYPLHFTCWSFWWQRARWWRRLHLG